MTLYLGLDSINTDDTTLWDAENAGKPVFDNSFDISSS